MMHESVFPIVSYAVQSKGPVLSGLMLDNGPALLASYLEKTGYMPVIFDFNSVETVEKISKYGKEVFLKEATDYLEDFYRSHNVKASGTKLYVNGFRDNVRIHEELKKRIPGLNVIAGGPQVDEFGEEILDYTNAFDVISYGDGDPVIGKFLDAVYDGEPLSSIPNQIRMGSGGKPERTKRIDISLDNLPRTLYDSSVYHDLRDKILIPVVEDSRGCPYSKCTFCIQPRIGGRHRIRPVEQLAEEIDDSGMLLSRLSGPAPSSEYISKLLKMLPGRKISAFAYADSDYECPDGLVAVFIGLESTDKNILENVLRKTGDAERYLSDANDMVKELKRKGVSTIVSMMVPCPWETQKSMESHLDYLADMSPDFVVTLPMGPLQRVPITVNARKDPEGTGILLGDDFRKKMMLYERDNLQRSEEWVDPPFKTKVNGKFANPFSPHKWFTDELMKEGMYPMSDENVLMAYLYHNGLSSDQNKRRKQCFGLMVDAREDIASGNAAGLREKVSVMNRNQLGGAYAYDI